VAENAEDRTEAATPKRLQRAREQGNVPLSREAAPLAVIAVAALVLAMAGPGLTRALMLTLSAFLASAHTLSPLGGLRAAGLAVFGAAAPLAGAALLAGAGAVLLQTRFLLNPSALLPDLSRLGPRRGLGRILGAQTLQEAAKSLLKLVIVGWAAWHAVAAALPSLRTALFSSPAGILDSAAHQVPRVLLWVLAAQAFLAGADIALTHFRHGKSLRMSRQDVKEEMRESEGDPHVKGRLKQLRFQRARRRMLAAVPKAAVVVTNPTHYAVALAYERGGAGAPRVVAKGVDEVAARIRALAREHGIPTVPNPPLARALWQVELDAEIPAEHYQAVAEIIAYVWRLRARAAGAVA
jgi:flagellar biosynthetic protein FlhB